MPLQEVMPAVSDNPAYKLHKGNNQNTKHEEIKKTIPDYEEIEELYFDFKSEDRNSIAGDYEPIEIHSKAAAV